MDLKRRHQTGGYGTAGFSLLELVLASAILGVVLASVVGVGIVGKTMTRNAERQNKATHAQQRAAEPLANLGAGDRDLLREKIGADFNVLFPYGHYSVDFSSANLPAAGTTIERTFCFFSSDAASRVQNDEFERDLPGATSGYYRVKDFNVAGTNLKSIEVVTVYKGAHEN